MRPTDIAVGIRYLAGTLPLAPPRDTTYVPLCAEVTDVGVTRDGVRRGVEVRWVHTDQLRRVADVSGLPAVVAAREIQRPWASTDYHQLTAVLRRLDIQDTHTRLADETASDLARLAAHHDAPEATATARTTSRGQLLKSDLTMHRLQVEPALALLSELARALPHPGDVTVRVQLHGLGSRALTDVNHTIQQLLGTKHSALSEVLGRLLDDADVHPDDAEPDKEPS